MWSVEWQSQKIGISQHITMSSSLIKINVGGSVFEVSKTTLTMDPESMLAKMCDTELSHERDSRGNIFLCRNPKAFEVIVEFLRTGRLFYKEIGVSLEQMEVEADFFGLAGLLEMIQQVKSPDDDGSRELIFVLTSKGSVSGPIFRLKTDGLLSSSYMFTGLSNFKNAMRATFPARTDLDFKLNGRLRAYGESYGARGWAFGRDKAIVVFGGRMSIKEKRSVWFCVRDTEEENILPPTVDLLDMESKILSDWDHYWNSAENCLKTKKIQLKAIKRHQSMLAVNQL